MAVFDLSRAYARRMGGAGIRRNVRGPTRGGGASPNFDSVPGLMLWLDPAADNLTLDGSDRASLYTSREGNAYAFTSSGSAMPLWEATGILGQPSLYFTTDDYMVCADAIAGLLDGTQDYSLVVVNNCESPGAGGTYGTIFSTGTEASSSNQIGHRIDGGTSRDIHVRNPGTGLTAIGSQSLIGANYMVVDVDANSTLSSSINDVSSLSSTACVGTPTCDRAYLGVSRFSGAFNSFLKGRIGDLVVYDHILTAGEYATVKAIIEAKYVGL